MTFLDLNNIIQVYNDGRKRVKLTIEDDIIEEKPQAYQIKNLGVYLTASGFTLIGRNEKYKNDLNRRNFKTLENKICMEIMETLIEHGIQYMVDDVTNNIYEWKKLEQEEIDKIKRQLKK